MTADTHALEQAAMNVSDETPPNLAFPPSPEPMSCSKLDSPRESIPIHLPVMDRE